jgi:hypothetical protein
MWASGGDTIAVVDADSTIMLSSVMMDTTITVSSINYTESVGSVISRFRLQLHLVLTV